MNLRITETIEDGRTVLALHGESDVYTAPYLKERITQALQESERDLALDLNDLEYIDAMGLGVLLGGLKRARERGRDLTIRCQKVRIQRVFEMVGIRSVFNVDWGKQPATAR